MSPSTLVGKRLLILGGSVRAAAQSALRAGLEPIGGDYFADVDLQKIAHTTRVVDYPDGLVAIAKAAPPAPWMYTGAMENHEQVIAAISQSRQLYGNGPDVLAGARDPARIDEVLRAADLHSPRISDTAAGLPRDGTWLRKRRRSGGGIGIAPLTDETDVPADDAEHYYQQKVQGRPVGAMFIGARGRATFVGVTTQSLEASVRHHGYHYIGSIGPLPLNDKLEDQLKRIGAAVAAEFKLMGIFGVDALVDDQDRVWPIEINPRYTASTEILDRAYGISMVGWHVAACRDGELPPPPNPTTRGWFGKQILYARETVTIPETFVAWAERQNRGAPWPAVADIPHAGTTIEHHKPATTVFAAAESERALDVALQQAVEAAERELYRDS